VSTVPPSGLREDGNHSLANGGVAYHRFSVTEEQEVTIRVNNSRDDYWGMWLHRDTGSFDSSSRIGEWRHMYNRQNPTEQLTLEPGEYVLSVATCYGIPESTLGSSTCSGGNGAMDYRLRIDSQSNWQETNQSREWGIQGLMVSLDESDPQAPQYQVISNGRSWFEVETTDDLSGYLGKELIGVHTFETLQVKGGASVDFGGDRVEVRDLANSSISGELMNADFTEEDLAAILDSPSVTGKLVISDQEINGISAGNMSLVLDNVTVDGDLILDGTTLSAINVVQVTGELALLSESKITVPYPASGVFYSLQLNVIGHISVEYGSSIDVTAKGYSAIYGGPDSVRYTREGCHGGDVYNGSNCTYGDYQRARFAGSGSRHRRGGGVVELTTPALYLYGDIQADGQGGYGNGGAGGSIHLDVGELHGDGLISASGGDGNSSGHYAGAGGRISLAVQNDYFAGSVQASSGAVGYASGAGTVYWVPTAGSQEYGDLTVNNGDRTTQNGSTPIKSVGRRVITGMEEVATGIWEVTVDGTPWNATNESLGWGLQGREVSLDAADEQAPLYRVANNAEGSLRIESADNLSVYLGRELIGIHTFNTVNILGQANVTFGSDRVVVLNPAESQVKEGAILQSGELIWSGSIALDGEAMTLSNKGQLVRIDGDLTLMNLAKVTVPYAQNYQSSLYPLRLEVTGQVSVEYGSSIDVTAKGYPNRHGGPEFGSRMNEACHGGNAYGHANCVYGAYERARFAGSGSYYSRGGGVVELTTPALYLYGGILADGQTEGAHGGAGGSIHLDVGEFHGDGVLSASGGDASGSTSYEDGAGGRISLAVQENFFTGGVNTASGAAGHASGAGTVYWIPTEEGQQHGDLFIDNNNYTAQSGSTLIRSVGSHSVSSIDMTPSSQWNVEVNPSDMLNLFGQGSVFAQGAGSIEKIPFTIEQSGTYQFVIRSGEIAPDANIFVNDSNLTSSDHLFGGAEAYTSQVGNDRVYTYELSPGSYFLAVGSYPMTVDDVVNGRSLNGISSGSFSYSISNQAGATWAPEDNAGAAGVSGREIRFVSGDSRSPVYTIENNDGYNLKIETQDDLSLYDGYEIQGIHRFKTLSVTGGASVDFSGDEVEILDLSNSDLSGEIINAKMVN